MLIVTNVISDLNDGKDECINKAAAVLGLTQNKICKSVIIKTSVDARHGKAPKFVSSVGFETSVNEKVFAEKSKNKKIVYRETNCSLPRVKYGKKELKGRPVVVGFGPAGMFAGLVLAKNGYRPLIIERGEDIDSRVSSVNTFWNSGTLNEKSNVQFGEGGAGTFSDGKLTTRINDPLCEFVLSEFVRFGAPEEILHKAKPHIGTDNLQVIVREIKKEIISLGGEVLSLSRLTDISVKNRALNGINVNGSPVACSALILAIGHSARDTFEMLMNRSISMEAKPFSVGVRIEHLQSEIDKGLYGKYAGHPLLPKGEYQLSQRKNSRAVYTFCMCPGGVVVPSCSEKGEVVTNGMSKFARDGKNANCALVVSVSENDFGKNPFEAINFQRELEKKAFICAGSNYTAPAQSVGCFLSGKSGIEYGRVSPSYSLGVKPCDFNKIFPDEITAMLKSGLIDFGKRISGFNASDALLTGPETRTSSPVRIIRNQEHECVSVSGIYPCGEGAGYAGGIMSAAVDGIKTAFFLMKKYKA